MKTNRVEEENKHAGERGVFPRPQSLGVSLVVLVLLLLVSDHLAGREKILPEAELDSFPTEIGEWKSQGDLPVDQKVIDMLQLSEYVNRWYYAASGNPVNLYIGFVPEQDQRPMIHSPTTCLPGAGWSIISQRQVPWGQDREGTEARMVNLVYMGYGDQRQLVCYWIQANQRVMANIYLYRFHLFFDSIFKRRSDGALVRFITPEEANESYAAAEERLRKFVILSIPYINEELPE